MRHRKATLKLNMTSSHRKAMFRNMVTSLFKYERIRTTDAKAKALRGWADHLITLAKRGDLHARRQALSIIREKDVVHKLFSEAPERFKDIPGGYTRIIKIGMRPGDAAPVSVIELVVFDKNSKPRVRKKKDVAEQTPALPEAKSEPDVAEAPHALATEQPPAEQAIAEESKTEESPAISSEPEKPAEG